MLPDKLISTCRSALSPDLFHSPFFVGGQALELKYRLLHPGDQIVSLLIGKQNMPENPTELLRASCFVFFLFVGDGYVLFHTLTRKLVWIAPALIRFFLPGTYSREEAGMAGADELYDNFFIVRDDTDEYSYYREIRSIYLEKKLAKGQIGQYIVLPLTACNARCVYCYEEAVTGRPLVMTDEIQDKLISFIRDHSSDSRPISIQWFGGEPLCGSSRIDKVCKALISAGISFSSSMITNGSLFTESLSEKAVKDWKLEEVQITLDGTKAEYEKRKRYLPGLPDPFGTVIRNIHYLLAAGIRVTIRLNADLQNIGDLFACVDFLAGEFNEEERGRTKVYAHELFSSYSDPDDLDFLLERVQELNMYSTCFFPMASDKGEKKDIFTFDPNICMADPAGITVVAAPDGRLFACEHMPEDLSLGTLDKGIDKNKLREINEARDGKSHCGNCPFLPICSDFNRCPARLPWPNCSKKMEREMKLLMKGYMTQGQKPFPTSCLHISRERTLLHAPI